MRIYRPEKMILTVGEPMVDITFLRPNGKIPKRMNSLSAWCCSVTPALIARGIVIVLYCILSELIN